MIHKFNQFINENNNRNNEVSVYDAINEPIAGFIDRAQERMDVFKESIAEIANLMDKAIETAVTEFDDVIVGEPIITVDSNLSEIEVMINTNVPNNDEAWEAEESSTLELEDRVSKWLNDYKNGIRADIYYKPNDEGNCVIHIHTYVIDKENFGDFTDALMQFGEDY